MQTKGEYANTFLEVTEKIHPKPANCHFRGIWEFTLLNNAIGTLEASEVR